MTARPAPAEVRAFAVERAGSALAGEAIGAGPPVVLLHGLTASRRYVVHGSRTLARAGFRQLAYDARGHGESHPAPAGSGYSYPELVGDLRAVTEDQVGEGPVVLAGHSMGAHTAVAHALERPDRVAGLVLAGPVFLDAYDEDTLVRWDRLGDALEEGGIDRFCEVVVEGLDPDWAATVERFTRERMLRHRHLDAMVRALREVPRSRPFESMAELEFLEVPALVVASHDVADPHHPYAVAQAYAERLPQARLVSEEEGQSPLPWQGGQLAREIAAFCAEPAVAGRLA